MRSGNVFFSKELAHMLRRVLRCKVPPATKPGIAAIVSNLQHAISFVVLGLLAACIGREYVQTGTRDEAALEVHVEIVKKKR